MKDRIKMIMERAKLTQQEFANKTGISAPNLSSIFTGRTNPTNKHVQAIHSAFPEISINWLLFGEGEPYIAASGSESDTSNASPFGEVGNDSLIPLFQSGTSGAQDSEGNIFSKEASVSAQKRLESKLLEKLLEQKAIEPEVVRRKITEIRVFFDDGTYETFSPNGK